MADGSDDSGATFGSFVSDDAAPRPWQASASGSRLGPIDDGFTLAHGARFAKQWLPVFEQPGGPRDEDVAAFVDAIYEDDVFVVFDWVEWQDQGHVLLETSGAMEHSDLDDLRRLLTMLVRQDKHMAGTVPHAVTQGWFHAALHRMAQLAEQPLPG